MIDLLWLVLMGALLVSWLKLMRARELATREVRRQCERHGLQLLDETVGLRALRIRAQDGIRTLERGYDFEVSIDGDDRESGRLWLRGDRVSGVSLPTFRSGAVDDVPAAARLEAASHNVVDLLARIRDRRDP